MGYMRPFLKEKRGILVPNGDGPTLFYFLKLVFLSESSGFTFSWSLPGFPLHQISCPLEAQMHHGCYLILDKLLTIPF